MDQLSFEPWKVEQTLNSKGEFVSHDLYRVSLRFRKGGSIEFMAKVLASPIEPFFLSFYAPNTGELLTSLVHGYSLCEIHDTNFDHLDALIELSPEQVLILFPTDEVESFGY